MGLFRALAKGIGWLFMAFCTVAGLTNDLDGAIEKWQKWGALSVLEGWYFKFPLALPDLVIWALALGLTSLLIWLLSTRPRRRIKEEFFLELEQRYPGLKERQRSRRSRRRSRGRKER